MSAFGRGNTRPSIEARFSFRFYWSIPNSVGVIPDPPLKLDTPEGVPEVRRYSVGVIPDPPLKHVPYLDILEGKLHSVGVIPDPPLKPDKQGFTVP